MIFYSNKEKFLFYIFPAVLFSLLPFFLITGPFLSDFSISLISLIFLIYCIKEKNFTFFKKKYFYFFIIFYLYLLTNSLFNNFNFDSLKISFFYFRYGIFVIAIVALFDVDSKIMKYFFYSILICFLILIIDGFAQYFYERVNIRISSFFGDEKILGSYLSRLWPIFFGLSILIYKQKEKIFYLFIIIFILSEALIFLSGERTSFFYINLSAIFVIFFSKKLLKLRLFTLSSSLLLIIIIGIFNPTAKERIIDQTLSQMNLAEEKKLVDEKKKDHDGIYIFSKQHTHHYITAYRIFLDNKVLGVGIKNFRNFCSNEKYLESALSCSTHPHNTYIQILSETGIIGFLFIMIALIIFIYNISRHFLLSLNKKNYFSGFEICILSTISITLWPFIPTGNFFNNWLSIIYYFPIGLLLFSLNNKNKTN